ncbi:MAG: metal-dependent hydrolase [Magnetococcales bacterium]|nr:metal-dependent hydrolase [Magnetococcales bacterium]
MADFRLHVQAAAVTGGVVAAALLVAGVTGRGETLACFAAAIAGGVLPDLDSDQSTPFGIAATLLAICFAFLLVFSQADRYSVLELLLLWLLGHLAIRRGIAPLARQFTVHRGIWHSLPALLFFAYVTVVLLWAIGGVAPATAWLIGTFVGIGVLVHLLLDELYGLTLLRPWRMRRSLGSALKLYSRTWLATGLMYLAVIGLHVITPPTDGLYRRLLNPGVWQRIEQRLLPTSGWFASRHARTE